eukprot:3773082-Pleurochrysis_carterae.AAC.7
MATDTTPKSPPRGARQAKCQFQCVPTWGVACGSELRCGIAVSGSDTALPQKHEGAKREQSLCQSSYVGSCWPAVYWDTDLSFGDWAYMMHIHYYATTPPPLRGQGLCLPGRGAAWKINP